MKTMTFFGAGGGTAAAGVMRASATALAVSATAMRPPIFSLDMCASPLRARGPGAQRPPSRSSSLNKAEWSSSPSPASTARCNCWATTANDGIGDPADAAASLDDPRVLAVQADPEPRVERAVEHALAVDLEDLRAGEPAEQGLADLRRVDAGAFGEQQGLGDRLDRGRHDELVARLRDLPGA